MGRLIVSTQMTVDGVIDVGEWYVADGEHDRAGKDQLGHASAVLLGRKTYEGLAAYWSPLDGRLGEPDQPEAEVRRVTHAARPARVELDAPRRRCNRRRLEAQGRAPFRPVDVRLRRVGPVRCSRRSSSTSSDSGFIQRYGARATRPLHGEAQNRLRLLGSEAFDSGVTLLRYAPI